MNAIAALNRRAVAAPPAPPIGARPERWGNGRIELQLYPAATQADRIAAAVALLAGTGFRVTKED